MRVFIHGSDGRPPEALHIKYVAPAADKAGQECPAHWVDADNKPITFHVEFVHGTAEVEDTIGKYLLDTGQVHRSRLVIPGYWGSPA